MKDPTWKKCDAGEWNTRTIWRRSGLICEDLRRTTDRRPDAKSFGAHQNFLMPRQQVETRLPLEKQ